jgi:lamin tail-like protein
LDAGGHADAEPNRDAAAGDASNADAANEDAAAGDTAPSSDAASAPDAAAACGAARAPGSGDLMINEVLADPPIGTAGDANQDGTRSSTDDEFVEIANISSNAILLEGVVLSDAMQIRHTFAAATLGCGKAIVVFGGGNTSGASWRSNWVVASSGAVSLNNSGDTLKLGTSASSTMDIVSTTYGAEAGMGQSIVRATELSPTAMFILHSMHPQSGGRLFSPGTRVDGTAF